MVERVSGEALGTQADMGIRHVRRGHVWWPSDLANERKQKVIGCYKWYFMSNKILETIPCIIFAQLLAGWSILQYYPSRTHKGRLRTKPIHFQPQLRIRRRSPTYLPNILVPNSTDLLNVCGTLWNVLQRIAVELYLILLILGNLYINTWVHGDLANNLLPDEISKIVRSKRRGRGIRLDFLLQNTSFPTYRMSTSKSPLSEFFSILTFMGKWA